MDRVRCTTFPCLSHPPNCAPSLSLPPSPHLSLPPSLTSLHCASVSLSLPPRLTLPSSLTPPSLASPPTVSLPVSLSLPPLPHLPLCLCLSLSPSLPPTLTPTLTQSPSPKIGATSGPVRRRAQRFDKRDTKSGQREGGGGNDARDCSACTGESLLALSLTFYYVHVRVHDMWLPR